MIDEKLMRIDTEFGNIAQSIRKNYMTPTETQYKPSEMAQGIEDMANNIKDTLYNYLPIKIVTDGICKNAVALPVKEIDVAGNNKQETTEGYQLFNKNDEQLETNKGKYHLNGSILSNAYYTYLLIENIKANTQYAFCGANSVVEASGDNIDVVLFDCYNGDTFEDKIIQQNVVEGTITTTANCTKMYVSIPYADKDTFQLVEGTTIKPYEPYTGGQASPNTEYPQDIEVIDGVNILNPANLSLFNTNKYIQTKTRIDVMPNTEYSIVSNKSFTDINVNAYSDDTNNENLTITRTVKGDRRYYTFTTKANTKTLFFYAGQDTEYATLEEFIETLEMMLIKGTQDLPYLPYGHIGLVQRGKNLLKSSKEIGSTYQKNGVTFTIKSKNVVNVKGTATADNTEIFFLGYNWIADKDLLGLKNNIKYTANMKVNTPKVYGYLIKGASEQVGTLYSESQTKTFIADEKGISKILIRVLKGVTVDEDIEFQIEKGEVATEIEPYHEPIVHPIDLAGNKLAKVGEIADLLKIARNGSVKIGDKVIKEYVFTGDEIWGRFTVAGSTTNYRHYTSFMKGLIVGSPTASDTSNVLCNMLIAKSPNQTYFGQEGISIDTDGTIRIYSNKTKEMTTDEIKNWLKSLYEADTPLRLLYETTEPTTIELPSIEPITLFEGTNVFELITNLGTTFTVEYVVDKNTILNDVQTALLDAEPEI